MVIGGDRGGSTLWATLLRYHQGLVSILWMSVALNLLTLSGSIYMMLVYDMVLPSRSVSTLLGLLLIVTVVYAFQAVFDLLRTRALSHVGAAMDLDVAPAVHRLIAGAARGGRGVAEAAQPSRDLDQIRAFVGSAGPTALMDLPWVLFFVAALAAFHPWLGVATLVGALFLVVLTAATELKSRAPAQDTAQLAGARSGATELIQRHAEEIHALGMAPRMEAGWLLANRRFLAAQQRLGDISTGMGGLGRIFRLLLQSIVLTVGAVLVIDGKATGGVIFASSILSARALAPIDGAIGNWKNFIAARQSWQRLDALLGRLPPTPEQLALPAPRTSLAVEHLTLVPPGQQRPTAIDVSFALAAGDGLAVIGPSASGKSSLARGLVGIWPPVQGKVRLDGGALDQWSADALGPHLGYLPQSVELMAGTIAANIARFEDDAPGEAVIAAAQAAGVHDLILRLPQGYETPVGADGRNLSAGQRQRLALARALYRDPFLVVLDEPNSNLDGEGEQALVAAIRQVRARGGIAVVIAHRQGVLEAVDTILVMQDGRATAFGPKSEIIPRLLGPRAVAAPVATQGGGAGPRGRAA